jgi:hypothetical protein
VSRRHRGPLAMVVALVALAALVTPRGARAEHTEEERIIDQTAYTLPGGRFQIGVLRQEVGLFDRLTVGTYGLPWIWRIYNGHAKFAFARGDPISLAVSAGIFNVTPDALVTESGNASVTALPFELTASLRISDAFTLSPAGAYTFVTLKGAYDPAKIEGVAALSNLQVMGTLEWRLTKVVALVVHGRYLVFQNAGGRVSATLSPDRFTRVDVRAIVSTNSLDYPNAYTIVPSAVLSHGVFNVRLGAGYGNYFIPGINLVLPNRGIVPDFDLYFRF